MQVSRREFLKYCISSAAILGFNSSVVGKLTEALAANGAGLPNVVWMNGANCTGCTVSLADRFSSSGPADVADLLINYINLAFHPNLMSAAGATAVSHMKTVTSGPYVFVIDGGIPTAFDGNTCIVWSDGSRKVTALEAARDLASRSIANLSVGTCASFGGVPAGKPNPTQVLSLSAATNQPTIKIPGCPVHPDWIIWTVAQLLAGSVPALDSYGRPAALFAGESLNVHKRCPRRGTEEAERYGIDGLCLKELGCRGPETQGDCPVRKWNSGTNFCMNANANCIGCTQSGFPDSYSPFYKLDD